MRLKEIKPEMAVHCKSDDEKKALLEEAERLGYVWYGTKGKPTERSVHDIGDTIHFYDAGTNSFSADYKHITHSCQTGDSVIEFSDLTIPELSAEEALLAYDQMCRENYCCNDCPIYGILGHECAQKMDGHISEIVDAIKKWKADHDKKQPEIETELIYQGRILEACGDGRFAQIGGTENIYNTGCDCLSDAWQYMSEKLKEYCKEHEGEYVAKVERVCRVKAVG